MFKRTTRILSLIAVALLVPSGCVTWHADYRVSEERILQSSVDTAGPLTVLTRNGSVTFQTDANLQQIEVLAEVRAGGIDEAEALARLEQIKVSLATDPAGGTRLEAIFPQDRKGPDGCSFIIACPPVNGITVRTSNGNVSITGAAGHAEIDTSNGRIVLVSHDGSANLDTSNGGIKVTGITGDLVVDTSNGAINLSELGGSVRADTSNGAMVLNGDSGFTGPFFLDTSNGSIQIFLPADFPGVIRTDTSNAHTRVAGAPTGSQISGDKSDKVIRLATAGDESVADTSNGSIVIEFVHSK